MVKYDIADARRLLEAAQAEEEIIDALFLERVYEVTLRTGAESVTIEVTREAGWTVVHELSLFAAERLEKAQSELSKFRQVEEGGAAS